MTNKTITLTGEGWNIPEGFKAEAEIRKANLGDFVVTTAGIERASVYSNLFCLIPEVKKKPVFIRKEVVDGGGYSSEYSEFKEFDCIDDALRYFLDNGYELVNDFYSYGSWRKKDNIYDYTNYTIQTR